MIHKVEFRNFKALRDVAIDLERFTVLVGPNSSGKTSVLEAIHWLSELSNGAPHPEGGQRAFPERLRTSGVEEAVILKGRGDQRNVEITISAKESAFSSYSPDGKSKTSFQHSPKHVGIGFAAVPIATNHPDYGPGVLLRLDVNRLAAPSYSDELTPRMDSDGGGLATVLGYMASNEPSDYQKLLNGLRSVIPILEGMRFPRAKVVRNEPDVITVDEKTITLNRERQYWGNSIEFDMVGAHRIAADMVSEGMLLVLGLLTVLIGPNRPRVLLLDDLDRALHPKAQEDLVGLLRKLLDQSNDLQIVATSHSPYLLQHLKPEEVRLMTLAEDGSAVCGRLDEHPEFEKWKEEMTPGEFWSVVGEKWLLEAKAGESR